MTAATLVIWFNLNLFKYSLPKEVSSFRAENHALSERMSSFISQASVNKYLPVIGNTLLACVCVCYDAAARTCFGPQAACSLFSP